MNAILFLGDFFRDGRCINMADSIIDAGKDIVIIDSGNGAGTYRNKKIYHIPLSASGIYKYLKFYRQCNKILKSVYPICIIAGDLYSLPSAASQSPMKLIYDSREIYTQLAGLKEKPIKQLFWRFIERIFINKASMVVVTADSDSEVLKSIYGEIPCITLKNFPSKKNLPISPIDLYSKFNIPKSMPIFLYQGGLLKGRGINLMIETLTHFKKAHAVIIGSGPFRNEAEQFSKKMGVYRRVYFIESVSYKTLLNYTSSATIGFSLIEPLSKSYEQALPNKIFEYALSGVPTLATNFPELKNTIEKYNLGITCSIKKMEDIYNGINTIFNSNYKQLQETAKNKLVWECQSSIVELMNED